MSLAVRIFHAAILSVALLVAACVLVSLLVGFALWLDDALHQRSVRRDARLADEEIRAIAEAGMRDLEELLGDHGHGPN